MYVKRNLKVLQLRQDNKLNKQTIIVDLSDSRIILFQININRIIIPRLTIPNKNRGNQSISWGSIWKTVVISNNVIN